MPNDLAFDAQIAGQVGELRVDYGVEDALLRQGKLGEGIGTVLHGRYYEQARNGRLFIAQGNTAPLLYTGTSRGLTLFNPPSSGVNCIILVACWGITTASTVAATIGLSGNTGQISGPGTAIADGQRNLFLGGPLSATLPYKTATVTTAGDFLLPLGDLHTGPLSTVDTGLYFIDVGGLLIIPPGAWGGYGASATPTFAAGVFGLVYAEVPA